MTLMAGHILSACEAVGTAVVTPYMLCQLSEELREADGTHLSHKETDSAVK